MKIAPRRFRPILFTLAWIALAPLALAGDKPKVPEGFEVRLVATVPAVQYPCQVATGPGGMLFVAEDPMDQTGPYESSNGRILLFREGQDPVVFAEGLRAVQGMAWHDNALYVSHMPFLTIVKDENGDGKGDKKTDLFKDLGPTNNQGLNDHIVSGIQFGMDGWLYISVGDKGIPKATGPDGRTIQIKGGGSVRCRPDGTEIEVVSTGTRNHLEVNLDDRDNVFTYDNTDDGLGWWTRVTHHIDGGYYGYAYDYHKRKDRFLNRMAEYGGGSPCGAVLYKDDAWPEAYRGVGFWAEWGKGKVHAFRFKPRGSTFEVAEAIDFAVPDGVSNFRPIDLAMSYDGKTMFVADWGMGGWGSKTEKVGRVWAISSRSDASTRPRGSDADSLADQIRQLDHPAFTERMRAQDALIKKGADAVGPVTQALADDARSPIARRHLIWTLDGLAGGSPAATLPILEQLKSSVPDLRAQAARAMGLRRIPLAIEPLKPLLSDAEGTVKLQALIALGRIGSPAAVAALLPVLVDPEPYVAYSAKQALRRIEDWLTVAQLGLKAADAKVRLQVLSAMDESYDMAAVGALIMHEMNPETPVDERVSALGYLADVHRKAKPWDGKWWGTQPAAGKPPIKEVAWEATPAIVETVHLGLSDRESAVRLAALSAVESMKDESALPILRERFASEPNEAVGAKIAATLGALKDKEALSTLTATLKDAKTPEAIRDAVLGAVEQIGTEAGAEALVALLAQDSLPVDRQPRILAALGKFGVKSALPGVAAKLSSADARVRAAALRASAGLGSAAEVGPKLRPLLADADPDVRMAAIEAAGLLKDRESFGELLRLADDPQSRFEARKALATMPDVRALQIYLQGLTERNGDMRRVSSSAVLAIRDQAIPLLERLAERHELSPSAIPELTRIYTSASPIVAWQVVGPLPIDARSPFAPGSAIDLSASVHAPDGKALAWSARQANDAKGQVDLNEVYPGTPDDMAAFAQAVIPSKTARKAQVLAGSDDTLTVWVNGQEVYNFGDRRGWDPEASRFEIDLKEGDNSLLIKCGNRGGPWQFSVALSSPSEYAFLKAPAAGAFNPDQYRDYAIKHPGSAEKGRSLFADLKGLACIKCHVVGGEGGQVGPDLSDIGVRYPKVEVIQSILYPSAKIFSGYEPVIVSLNDGRILTGIVKSDDDEALEIQDAEAKRIRIPKADIEEKKVSDVSLMPNGLAEGLSQDDFADLVSYLETLKEKPPAAKP